MAQLPAQPLRPELGPDKLVRLVHAQWHPRLGHSPRPRGEDLLPGQSALEQEVAWVFPALASTAMNPRTLRDHMHNAYAFAIGALIHRQILRNVQLRDDWAESLPAVVAATETFLERDRAEPFHDDTLKLVANLEMSVDIFGPASEWQLRAYWWGLIREFQLGQQWVAASNATTWEQVRYQSLENLLEQEDEFANSILVEMGGIYLDAAFDIVALWNAQPSLAQRMTSVQRQERNRAILRGTVSTLGALYSASESVSRRRARNALTDKRRAQASYLRRR